MCFSHILYSFDKTFIASRQTIADRETSLDIIREDAISIYREYLSDKVSSALMNAAILNV